MLLYLISILSHALVQNHCVQCPWVFVSIPSPPLCVVRCNVITITPPLPIPQIPFHPLAPHTPTSSSLCPSWRAQASALAPPSLACLTRHSSKIMVTLVSPTLSPPPQSALIVLPTLLFPLHPRSCTGE